MPESCVDFGCLFIVAAPSGGGKTSLVKQLVSKLDNIETSISHTTRIMRPAEKDGVDYFFISEQEFSKMIKKEEFIEHAVVFENFYGTSKAQIEDRLQSGVDVVLDIDWQGAQQIKKIYPDSVSIFILPPSVSALESRLINRAQDNENIIANRMHRAHNEMSHYSEFDYLIINDDFAKAVEELVIIVKAQRLSMSRQIIKQQYLLSLLINNSE